MRFCSSPTRLLAATTLAAATIGLAACGGDDTDVRIKGDLLVVYAGLPLEGERSDDAEDIVNGIKLALADSGGKAGEFNISPVFMDDTAGRPARWDPHTTGMNARRAAQDSRAIAYIGDFDSGATRISLPITNQARILQVSPASTAVGLTRSAPGTPEGTPELYYPTGNRTFARVVPNDTVLAGAAARWADSLGVRSAAVVTDGSEFGDVLIGAFRGAATDAGIDFEGGTEAEDRSESDDAVLTESTAGQIAREAARGEPDAVYFGGTATDAATALLRRLGNELPRARIFVPDALMKGDFLESLGDVAGRLHATSPVIPVSELSRPARRFAEAYEEEFNEEPGPYAAYGYEAMAAIIGAIEHAGEDGSDRGKMIESMFAQRRRGTVLGSYSIDRHGDTSLRKVAGYRVREGRPRFDRTLTAAE